MVKRSPAAWPVQAPGSSSRTLTGGAARGEAESIRAEGREAGSYTLDVASRPACEALAESVASTVGSVSCLVNNAGVLYPSRIGDADATAILEKTSAVNVHGPFNVKRAFLPALRQTRGCVVNVGSIQSFVAAAYSTAYATSKGAVAQLTRTLAAEFVEDGIRVNAIAPGLIETAMTEVSRADDRRMQAFRAHTPMKPIGLPLGDQPPTLERYRALTGGEFSAAC